jgi:hypothetical protein
MSTNINIKIIGELLGRTVQVQEVNREEKGKKEEKAKTTKKIKENKERAESEEGKRRVWEPADTRPYYNPVRQDDGLLAVWALTTEDNSTYRYYISGATANNWKLLYEKDKPSSGGGGSNFFGDNFASIISGNPFGIPAVLWPGDDVPNAFNTSGYWNGRWSQAWGGSAPWNGQWYTPWVYWNHIQHPFYGACSAWVDDLGSTGGGTNSETEAIEFWPRGGLLASCVRRASAGGSGSGVRRFLWHGIGGSDIVGGKQQWRHMYKDFPFSAPSVGYSESSVGLQIAGNSIENQGTSAGSLFAHFYSQRGLGSYSSSFVPTYGQMNFTRTGRNNWMMGWNEIGVGSFSIIGTYKQACVDLGLSTSVPPVPSIPNSSPPITWLTAMNLMNDRVGAPGGAPKIRTFFGTSGMKSRPGNNNGRGQLRAIKPESELKNPLINNIWTGGDLEPAFSNALLDDLVKPFVSTPQIYNNASKTMIPNPGWTYYADKNAGAFAISSEGLSNDTQEIIYQGKIEMLKRITEVGFFVLKKHVEGVGYIGSKSCRVSVDTDILESLVLDPIRTNIQIVFITDWGQPSRCRQAAASLGLGDPLT